MDVQDLQASGPAAHGTRATLRDRPVAVRITGARGVGKTTVIETTARALSPMLRLCVVTEEPADDAGRLRAAGATVTTLSPLNASTIGRTLAGIGRGDFEYAFIEDRVDLARPSIVDLGEHVTVLAVPARDAADAALQLAVILEQVDLVLLTKTDEGTTSEAIGRARERIGRVMPRPGVLAVSAQTGAGIDQWLRWLSAAGRRRSPRCALGAVGM